MTKDGYGWKHGSANRYCGRDRCGGVGRLLWIGCVVEAAAGGTARLEVLRPQKRGCGLPLQIGDWRGERVDREKMDPKRREEYDKIADKTGAAKETIEDRSYHDDLGHTIMLHAAMFDDPNAGVYHVPANCYRAAGWKKMDEYRETLQISEDVSIPVNVTAWERENEHVLVVYWLQLGEHVLFDRSDLGLKVRWAMRGQPKWPALMKVMLSMPANDWDEAKPILVGFAEEIAKWENQPEHQTGVTQAANRAAGGDANASP